MHTNTRAHTHKRTYYCTLHNTHAWGWGDTLWVVVVQAGGEGGRLMDMHFIHSLIIAHILCFVLYFAHQDFNDAQNHVKANALSQQTGGLPLKLQITSLMCEDRTGYQLVTVKLTDADKPTDQGKFDRQPVG